MRVPSRCRECRKAAGIDAKQITVDEETPLGPDKPRWVVIWHCPHCGWINVYRSYPRQVAVLLAGGALCLPQARFADRLAERDFLAMYAAERRA